MRIRVRLVFFFYRNFQIFHFFWRKSEKCPLNNSARTSIDRGIWRKWGQEAVGVGYFLSWWFRKETSKNVFSSLSLFGPISWPLDRFSEGTILAAIFFLKFNWNRRTFRKVIFIKIIECLKITASIHENYSTAFFIWGDWQNWLLMWIILFLTRAVLEHPNVHYILKNGKCPDQEKVLHLAWNCVQEGKEILEKMLMRKCFHGSAPDRLARIIESFHMKMLLYSLVQPWFM